MTEPDRVALARERITQMIALSERTANVGEWHTGKPGSRLWRDYPLDAAYIVTASPDLMLRLAREALNTLDRHTDPETCKFVAPSLYDDSLCPELEAVLRAWLP